MITCSRCDHEIQHGDEYKIAYDKVWCVECTEEHENNDSFGMTYILLNLTEGSQE